MTFLGMASSSFGSRTMVARHPKGLGVVYWDALPPGISGCAERWIVGGRTRGVAQWTPQQGKGSV